MEQAKQLLRDPRYKITDISSKVGYSDGNYFGKSFKKYTGSLPLGIQRKEKRMNEIFSQVQKKWWADTGLQAKFTAALMTLILVPAIFVGVFFYSRLYDMVVADTIRKEQDISAKTAPLIESTVNSVLNTAQTVSSLSFYRTLFEKGINMPFSTAASSSEAEKFHKDITRILERSILTGFQIYVDLPNEDSGLFTGEYTKDIFAPLSHAKGTYWYGIFQDQTSSSLFCPPFYLGEQEQHTYGNESYIRTDYIRYHDSSLKVLSPSIIPAVILSRF